MSSPAASVYARAAFEFAQEADTLPAWQLFLQHSAEVFANPEVKRLFRVAAASQRELLADLEELLQIKEQGMKHFLWLLADKKRLLLLPEVTAAFGHLCAEANQQITATVLTTVPLEQTQEEDLQKSLTKRMGKEVCLDCHVDTSIGGGIMIKMGDKVIDRTLRGSLLRLKKHMLG
jgi:F-type H+-transporting ATPase subunit delta